MTTAVSGSLALFAPPRTVARADRLPLGTRVAWTHRAAVARWKRASAHERGSGLWLLTEGVRKYEEPRISPPREGDSEAMIAWMGTAEDDWYMRPPRDRVNKTVLVWPTDGEGVVIGLVRRAIGESVPAQRGSGSFFEEPPDPGYFAADAYVHEGVRHLLVPHWAVEAL